MRSSEFNVAMERAGCPVRAKPGESETATIVEAVVWLCEELARLREEVKCSTSP